MILNQLVFDRDYALKYLLLNSNIKLFALKFKNWSFKDNSQRYIFLIISLVLLATMKFLAIPAIIALYILSSLVGNMGGNANPES